jgi:hypothetical protein
MIDRRDFLKTSVLASAASLLPHGYAAAEIANAGPIAIQTQAPSTLKTRLAATELSSGLRLLNPAFEVKQTSEDAPASVLLTLAIDPSRFRGTEQYEIAALNIAALNNVAPNNVANRSWNNAASGARGAILRASTEQALLFAVFDFLEHQGLIFGIDGTTAPLDRPNTLRLPMPGQPWTASPSFAVRGLLPWPDFLNCISVYNEEDFKAYFAAMLRMRFNMFGMHVYTENDPGPLAESYLSFDFAGSGHRAALEDSSVTSWGYLPQRTSTFKMGAADFFDKETFGADATRLASDNWDIADRTTAMMRSAFQFAHDLGIRTGIGFEPYKNPAEIVRALPPEALSHPGGFVESNTARDLLERRLADLLERYPMVDYVWLWQDEGANWDSREKNVPLSVTPFAQAHAFLQRHAPGKRLVLAGWGGVTRHFENLHQRLPEDIVFSALSDSLGWDPIHEAFGKLGSRERWPIPWLEDDPSMWFPQFRASRFQTDMRRAQDLGCQGMLGIHWRHRIVDPTATYLARASWNRELTAPDHYRNFCKTQASAARAEELATLFDDCDRNHAISSTFLGTYDKSGFANRVEIAGDYSEAFNYSTSEPELAVLATQRKTAERFRQLASQAASPLEHDRIGYFAGFVGLMVPYCDAYERAHQLDAVLKHAVELRAAGKQEEARAHVLQRGVPLWLAIAPLVRQTMLQFQAIVATRNDLGQLASMQNKFVRIALERLRLSIKEFLSDEIRHDLPPDLPPEMDRAYAAAISPEGANPPRLFLPTRPSLLQPGDSLRLFINVSGEINVTGEREVVPVQLFTRRQGAQQWASSDAPHAGRNVYTAQLGPFTADDIAIDYYATIAGESQTFSDPPQAPLNVYTLNILG